MFDQSSSAQSKSVKRSNSVPVNLAEDAQEFMTTVMDQSSSQSSSIPEDRALSPSQLADSFRTDDADFFLPMDEEEEEEENQGNDDSRTRQQIAKVVAQQQHRQAAMAMAKLEEFFMGESSSSATQASPVSVLDVPSTMTGALEHEPSAPTPAPKRNMFGQLIEESSVPKPPSITVQHQRARSADAGLFLEAEPDEDAASISTQEHEPRLLTSSFEKFTKLKASDRAHSLPLEYITRSSSSTIVGQPYTHTPLTKKASLKKISSYGQGLFRKDSCEGSLQRTVSFSNLSIREYPPAISDNPSCSFGPPVQLDWEHEAEETHPIDHYEEYRQPRRTSHDLLLSYYDRRFLLIKQAGYSRREVKEAMKEAERVKRERMVTDLFLPAQALDETMETVVDTVKRFFTKKNISQDV
jgi:hypothetical protein